MAALYVYAAYAPFEDAVNRYMSLGVVIRPEGIAREVGNILLNQSSTPLQLAQRNISGLVPISRNNIRLLDQ